MFGMPEVRLETGKIVEFDDGAPEYALTSILPEV
jgi:hypothetical protein